MSRGAAFLTGSAAMAVQVVVRMVGVLGVGHLLSRLAGGEMLGAYSAIWQLIWLVQLLEMGVSLGIGRQIGQQWEHPESDAVRRRLPRNALGLLLLIGLAMAVALSVGAWTLPDWFRASDPVRRSASVALMVAAAWMPLRFVLSFFSLFLFARQRLAAYGLLGTGSEALRVGLTLGAVWAGWGLPGMMVATLAAETFNYGIAWWLVREELPLREILGVPDPGELWVLIRTGVPLGMISLGERLALFSQDLVVGAVVSARAASEFYATRMPGFILVTVLAQLLYSLSPGLNHLYGQGLHDAFRRANLRLVTYAMGVGLWGAAGVLAFTRPLVSLWVGPEFFLGLELTAAVALVALLAPFNNVGCHFAMVTGRVRVYTTLVMAAGVLAVVLSLALGARLGAASVMWASLVAQCLSAGYLAHLCGSLHGIGPLAFLRRMVAGAVPCAAAGVAACALYALLARAGVAPHLLVALPLAVMAGAAGFLRFGLFPEDRALVHGFLRRKVLRRVEEQHV